MAKSKSKNKKGGWSKPKASKERKDPRVQEIYEKEIEFVCPVRGKIKQKVKIKRYKTSIENDQRQVVYGSDSIDRLDEKDDGLNMFGADDDIDLTNIDATEE